MTETIAMRLERVREAIAQAAHRADRDPAEIALIAVSKTHPPSAVAEAVAAGQRLFGENTVQDALTKIPHLAGQGLNWHFLGHLQSNKARFLPGHFQWLHALHSVALATRLERLALADGASLACLIEVNITRHPGRQGVAPEALPALLEGLLGLGLTALSLRGLMALGPYPAGEREVRAAFAQVRALRDDCRQRFGLADFNELSMGMSGDFAEAILEGSTLVRIGSAIFGER